MLESIGDALSTRVLFLKGAWSGPTLYGPDEPRPVQDVDVLVSPTTMFDFAKALVRVGFVPWGASLDTLRRRRYLKAITMTAPGALFTVDLHSDLGYRPWFQADVEGCIARAVLYQTAEGPILSLCPEDQVLHLAVHTANEGLLTSAKQLEDIARLLETHTVDWELIEVRAKHWGVRRALKYVLEQLQVVAPHLPTPSDSPSVRCAINRGLLRATQRTFRLEGRTIRRSLLRRIVHHGAILPLIADSPAALPRYLWYLATRRFSPAG